MRAPIVVKGGLISGEEPVDSDRTVKCEGEKVALAAVSVNVSVYSTQCKFVVKWNSCADVIVPTMGNNAR